MEKVLSTKPKLRIYVKFKNICTEDYVKYCASRGKISQKHHFELHIQTGICRENRLDERVCLICNSGQVENGLHVLCVCTTYCKYWENIYF